MKKIMIFVLFVSFLFGQFGSVGILPPGINSNFNNKSCRTERKDKKIVSRECNFEYEDNKENEDDEYGFKYEYVDENLITISAYVNEKGEKKSWGLGYSDILLTFKNKNINKAKFVSYQGIILYETQIRNNLYHGQFKRYGLYNTLIETATYDEGYLHGERAIYYTSGEYEYLIPYTKGIINGTIEHFNEDGELREEVVVKDGSFVKGWAYRGGEKRKLNPAQKRKWEKMIEKEDF